MTATAPTSFSDLHHVLLKVAGPKRITVPPSGADANDGILADDLAQQRIPRHRTALTRPTLSKPVRCALEDGIIHSALTVLDYGCGRGSDVARLTELGIACLGWDPEHAPEAALGPADVVNIGYVVNVIETQSERRDTLHRAWSFTRQILVVSARLTFDALGQSLAPFGDGFLTSAGTFQKFFGHTELREWIASTIDASPVAAAPGVFYVFREPSARESFVAGRLRRAATAVRVSRSQRVLGEHRQAFDLLVPFFAERGRLPSVGECPGVKTLYRSIPTLSTILSTIQQWVGGKTFDTVVSRRREDLLVYLALARFSKRLQLRRLPEDLQLDILSFFPTYVAACEAADELLFQLGNDKHLNAAMEGAKVGKLTGSALYVHVTAVSELPLLARLFEGCARTYAGTIEGATLVKLHRHKPQVSYLAYPRFNEDPHPALLTSVVVDLGRLAVRFFDYSGAEDPPVLHRKELFVGPDYPGRPMFERLTKQEAQCGLLSGPTLIGSTRAWAGRLRAAGLTLRGHRVVRLNAK